ncbi:hypothetical protein ACFC08_02505 [Streptomyces sp. NPDC056112]|uniref:hypothetical protein n=1 Tax=Streptomyces sp. NPDC056112 TaxID=3345715 RepID=UPI0035E37C8A
MRLVRSRRPSRKLVGGDHRDRGANCASSTSPFDDAVAAHPEVPRPDLMVLRHTHVQDDPEGWRPAAAAISKFYRTFDAWFGNRTTPVNGFLDPSP